MSESAALPAGLSGPSGGFTRNGVMPLRDAVERYRALPGAWANTYEWWRESAKERGRVSFGVERQFGERDASGTSVEVFRVGRRWFVHVKDVERALREHQAAQDELRAVTDAYSRRELLGASGQPVKTTWGHYTRRGAFHERAASRAGTGEGASGYWVCNECWQAAEEEHGWPECHLCRDWGSCGRNCTLSAVGCRACGTRITV